MLVEKLFIKGFRGIRELAKPIELDEFTVLIGRNNVGKTAILEALYMLTVATPGNSVGPYGVNPHYFISSLHGGSKSLIYGYYGNARIRYEFALKHKPLIETELPLELPASSIVELELDTMGFRFLQDYEGVLKVLITLGVRPAGDRDILAVYIPNDSRAFENLLGFAMRDEVLRWAEKEGYNARVARLVSEVVYDRFTEVLLRGQELSLRKEGAKGPMYVDLRSVGEGVRRFVLVYYAVEYINPRLVLWDDIEVSMHPSLLRVTLNWLAGSGRQVVISTHSLDTLYNLALVHPRNCRVMVLRKTPDDVVDWRAFTLDEIEELLDSRVDPRKIVDELEL